MNLKAIFLVFVIIIVIQVILSTNSSSKGGCPNLRTSLNSIRKRRHLAFPTGSAASVIASVVKTFMTHVPSGWYFVIEVEVVYPLPDAKLIAMNLRKKLHHRQKRLAWELLQGALDGRNINGRACIIRSVCETEIYLAAKGKSLVHDILRTLFTNIKVVGIQYNFLPLLENKKSAPLHEEEFLEVIGGTYDELLQSNFCEKGNDCPFSLLKFILDMNKNKYYSN